MHRKRKHWGAGLLLSMALIVSGCGTSGDDAANTDNTAPAPGGIRDRNVKIAFSAPGADHGWLAAVTKNARDEAARYDDVDFQLLEGTNDSATQVSQVEALIASQPDVLVILPHEGGALTPVALRAQAAGIRVVNVDRAFTDPAAARLFIAGDNYGAGYQAGRYFADQLRCQGNVAEIQGLAGIQVTAERTRGFADAIRACNGGIRIIAQQPADFLPDRGQQVMTTILQGNRDIDAVFTHDDDMAEGVVRAIELANRQGEMFVTGVGGSEWAMERIDEGGVFRATFLYNPAMSASAVRAARLIARGEGVDDLALTDVPAQVVIQSAAVTKDNVEQYRHLGFTTS